MAFFFCSQCDSQFQAIQVSRKIFGEGEQRTLKYEPGTGIQMGDWQSLSESFHGFRDGYYCPKCFAPIELDKNELPYCEDKRIPAITSQEFSIDMMLPKLKKLAEEERAQIYTYTIPEKPAQYAEPSFPLPEPIQRSLEHMGIHRLYQHQATALDAVRRGENVVLVTSTASGKTLSYNLPILEHLYNHPDRRALYIFPTKALTHDQMEQIGRFNVHPPAVEGIDTWFEISIAFDNVKIVVGRIDGDTPYPNPRERIMSSSRIWMTNPDMIHAGLLRQAQNFRYRVGDYVRTFLKNLRFIVLDEMHIYRGTFGSHVGLVLRRLRKVCHELGNPHIQIIACSATIENPIKLATDLTGVSSFTLIDQDGAAHKRKEIVLWNPGMSTDDSGRRAPSTEAIEIAKQALTDQNKVIKSIIFQPSRNQTMVFTKYIKDVLRKPLKLSKERIEGERLAAYYTGILPNETRRRIIERLKSHEIHVLVTTNALEVGIDIGDLSVAIVAGYPGSKAAFSQQVGRVGRNGEGLAILIWQDDPLQQYYMRNPKEFLNKRPEVVRINPFNYKLLLLHLPLLESELGRPLTERDVFELAPHLNGEMVQALLESAASSENKMENSFSLRAISGKSYVVKARGEEGAIVEGLDEWSALRDFHEGAIHWTPDEKTYKVDSINRNTGEIILLPVSEPSYYTQSTYKDHIDILQQYAQRDVCTGQLFYGELEIKRTVFGYRKIFFGSKQEPEQMLLEPPFATRFTPEGTWLVIGPEVWSEFLAALERWSSPERDVDELAIASLHAAQHGISSVIPDIVICDVNDFTGFSSANLSSFAHQPVIGFYGENGFGLGTIEAIYEKFPLLIEKAVHLIESCPCAEGCPSCVHLPHKDNEQLFKPGAIILLKSLLKRGDG